MNEMNEKRALRAIQKGDAAGLEWLMDRYTPYVATIVGNIIGSSMAVSDVEEVTSDVFITLWACAVKVQPNAIRAWLGAVARNKARNKLRQQRTGEVPLEENAVLLAIDPMEDAVERRELSYAVRTAVLQMQQPDREIFLRHYYYYQSVADIGAQMQINESTVKSRLRRGREKLKQALIKGGFADEMQDQRFGECCERQFSRHCAE